MRSVLAGVVLLSGVSLASSLDRTALKAVLRRGTPGFKRCYEAALRRDRPDLAGKARLVLTVGPSGQVTEATVEFRLDTPDFTACLREVAMKLRFLKGPAQFQVTWPIQFKAT